MVNKKKSEKFAKPSLNFDEFDDIQKSEPLYDTLTTLNDTKMVQK